LTAATRALWIAVIIIFSLMTGGAAGVMRGWKTGDPIAGIFAGAAGFAGTVFLLLAMGAFLVP